MSTETDTAAPAGATGSTEAERLPLTEAQKGLLVIDGRVPAREIYNQVIALDIDPRLTGAVVADALAALAIIQPALRQVFGLLPQMHARLAVPLAACDLPLVCAEVGADDFPDAVAQWAVRLGQPAFELTMQPPWRAGYLRARDGSRAAILLVIHHIIGDGVSLGPLARDLESILAGDHDAAGIKTLRATREAALIRELRVQNRIAGTDATAERAQEWARRLREVPAQVLCPRPGRPAETRFTGARLDWLLTPTETGAFTDTARDLQVTPFVLFSAVFSAVIARHTGTATVLIGSPFVARRTVAAFELCGFFVNTLPVQVDVDWTRPFSEHASEVTAAAVDYCRANVDVAFNQIVAAVAPDRSTNRNPLFSHVLAMQDTYDGAPGGLIRGVREPGNGTAKFDLWLGATPVDGSWLLELEYDTELISPAAADGLLGSLRHAVRQVLADSSQPLSSLFADDSATASRRTDGYPADVPIAALAAWLTASTARRPDAVAIEDQTGAMSYAELATAAAAAGRGLARLGVRSGDVVGVCMDTLSGTTIAILAILACGAAYLPLDPSLPAQRLRYMVARAGCRIAVVPGGGTGGAPDIDGLRQAALGELVSADDQLGAAETDAAGTDAAGTDAQPALESGPPAYVMFTSGSTGEPKGVLMGQGPLANLTAWQLAALEMDERTRFLQYAPLGFDVSFQEIVPTLIAGGTIVSREPADRRDFPALTRRLATAQVTHVYLPVAALRPFTQAVQARGTRLPALRYVCVSGEQLLVDEQIREFFVAHPQCVLVNLYGPTETHAVTTYRLRAAPRYGAEPHSAELHSAEPHSADQHSAEPRWPEHVPIGLPITGVHGYVVDATGHLAPTGVPGELYLGGRCPADGYINDPARTAAVFLPDRFAGTGSMYRTGDRVIRDACGELVFLGRDDTQVKVRGYRIELGEIEAVANAAAGVRQAVAAARGGGADRELVLFVLAADGTTVDHDQLVRRLRDSLPAYMIPARILDVDAVPVTGAGKTDRDALVALADRLIAEAAPDVAQGEPQYSDDLERELADLWSQILGVTGIRRDRPVIDYGAHSLNIVTALAEVAERYDIAPPIADFLRSPTVATLAELVRGSQTGDQS